MVHYHLAGLPGFAITQFQPMQESSGTQIQRLKFHAARSEHVRPDFYAARLVGFVIRVFSGYERGIRGHQLS